ncbi:TonB family protein [Roseovarius sp. S1116L3]|uniref:energy transducer TonB family protein n=1 Tax=Roseovarius roseus TaxID=3342636 RepID=UPI003728959F
MIASSARIKLLATGAAVLAHAAFAVGINPDPVAEIEGGAGAPEARIGTSFADMVSGTLTSQTTKDTLAPVKAPAPERAAQPDTAPAPRPETAQPTTPTPKPEVAPAPAPEALAALAPSPAAKTATPDTSAAPKPPEAQRPMTDAPEAVSRSLRPAQRSKEFEAKNKSKTAKAQRTPVETPKPRAQPAPRGNAQANATAGATRGSEAATAKSQGTERDQSTAAGTAAASNYPGLVMRKISNVRKPRMSRAGSARVSFSVAQSGALAGVSIARSSGRADLDREALRLIQRAAPFPAPPASAQRTFAIDIQFR